MVGHLIDGVIVRYHESLESQFITKHIRKQPLVSAGRDPLKIIERRHYTQCSGIDGGFVGRQVAVAEHHLRHVHRIVIPSGLRSAVSGKMLHARKYGIAGRKVVSLITADHGGRHLS